jgi:phosphohistidine phosphatase
MKQITIVRHSKAETYQADRTDFERVLTDKGRSKARLVAGYLQEQGVRVSNMISSPAARAHQTAQIFADYLRFPPEQIQVEEGLYDFGGYAKTMELLRRLPDTVHHVMLFGHNPTFTALAWHLCSRFRHEMPTSAVVGIELPVDHWHEIQADEGRLMYFYTRKIVDQLKAGN